MDRAEVDLKTLLSTMHRQFALIFTTLIISLSIAAAHLFTTSQLYSATALVLFDQTNKNLLEPESSSSAAPTDRSRIESEVELMQSDAVLLSVIRDEHLTLDPEFAPAADTSASDTDLEGLTLEKLRKAISVERRGTTLLLAVTAHSTNGLRSAQLANQIAQNYISLQVEQKVQNLLAYRALLGDHLEAARASFETTSSNYDRFIDANIDLIIAETGQPELLIENQALHDEEVSGAAAGLREQLHQKLLTSPLSHKLAFKLYQFQQTEDFARGQYQSYLQRYQALTAQTSLQVPDSRIVSPAQPPTRASSPNIRLTFALAAAFGIFSGIVLALLYENLVGGFITSEQLEDTLHVTKSASLPKGRARTEKDSLSELIIDRPHAPYSEAIRRLRATIGFALADHSHSPETSTFIVITSATANEGKTTTAVSLARCYALAGKATLLIDGDLRAPSVHQHLITAPSLTLLETVRTNPGAISAVQLASADPLTPLSVINGARQTTTATGEILNSRAFEKLIASARSNYEIVILDTPPVASLTDVLYVAPLADIILLVTKWATTSQREVKQATQALRNASSFDQPILPVLTQVKDHRSFKNRKMNAYYAQPAQ